jgi:hypothetical protein
MFFLKHKLNGTDTMETLTSVRNRHEKKIHFTAVTRCPGLTGDVIMLNRQGSASTPILGPLVILLCSYVMALPVSAAYINRFKSYRMFFYA